MNREEIKNTPLKVVPVDCDWGVFVRHIDLAERRDLIPHVSNEDSVNNTLALVVAGCCDEHGNKLFTDEDKEWLAKKHYGSLEAIAKTFLEINQMGNRHLEEAKKN